MLKKKKRKMKSEIDGNQAPNQSGLKINRVRGGDFYFLPVNFFLNLAHL